MACKFSRDAGDCCATPVAPVEHLRSIGAPSMASNVASEAVAVASARINAVVGEPSISAIMALNALQHSRDVGTLGPDAQPNMAPMLDASPSCIDAWGCGLSSDVGIGAHAGASQLLQTECAGGQDAYSNIAPMPGESLPPIGEFLVFVSLVLGVGDAGEDEARELVPDTRTVATPSVMVESSHPLDVVGCEQALDKDLRADVFGCEQVLDKDVGADAVGCEQ